MRVSAGVAALTEREGPADVRCMVCDVDHGTAQRSIHVTMRRDVATSNRLEKKQTDQDHDRNPRDRVRDDDAVPQSAIGRQCAVRHQRTAVQTFGHHGRLPGSVPQGGRLARIAAVSLLSKRCDPRRSRCALIATSRQAAEDRLAFD